LEEILKFNVRIIAAVAVLAFAAGGLFIAACSGGDDASDAQATDQAALDAVKDQATKAQILATETVFRLDSMHELDDQVGAATEIDPDWQGRVTRMRRAVASVTWPSELQEKAAAELAALQKLETDLINQDLAAAKADVGAAHDGFHELDSDAYPYIAGETPAPMPTTSGAGSSASPGM
jgi:hypothetical protein